MGRGGAWNRRAGGRRYVSSSSFSTWFALRATFIFGSLFLSFIVLLKVSHICEGSLVPTPSFVIISILKFSILSLKPCVCLSCFSSCRVHRLQLVPFQALVFPLNITLSIIGNQANIPTFYSPAKRPHNPLFHSPNTLPPPNFLERRGLCSLPGYQFSLPRSLPPHRSYSVS